MPFSQVLKAIIVILLICNSQWSIFSLLGTTNQVIGLLKRLLGAFVLPIELSKGHTLADNASFDPLCKLLSLLVSSVCELEKPDIKD